MSQRVTSDSIYIYLYETIIHIRSFNVAHVAQERRYVDAGRGHVYTSLAGPVTHKKLNRNDK